MRASFVLSSLVVALVLALTLVSGDTAGSEESGVTSFYGILELPPSYFQHPDSDAPINRIQPGTVVLHNSHTTLSVPVQRDGTFVFYGVPYGTYLLQADYHDFIFPTVRVDVQYKEKAATAEDGARATPKTRVPFIRSFSNDYPVKPLRGSGVDEQSPTVIPSQGVHEYYVPREEFHLLDILKSPMIVMMLVSFGLMGMMKLFPEEDMKESQKMSREWQQKLLNRAAGVSAEDASAAEAAKSGSKKRN